MGNRRRAHPPLLTPRAPIEYPSQSRKQNVSPVEVHCALVEVREPEQNGSRQQRPAPPETAFQKVLHPAAKEELLGNRNKEKRKDPAQHYVRNRRNVGVEVKKPKRQSKNSSERMSPYPVSSILKISMTGDLSCRRMRQTPSEVTVDLRTKRRISSWGCYRVVMHRYLGYPSCLRRSASVDERGKTR